MKMDESTLGNLFQDLLQIGAGNVTPAAEGLEQFNRFANSIAHHGETPAPDMTGGWHSPLHGVIIQTENI
jgi:hypothetical protein